MWFISISGIPLNREPAVTANSAIDIMTMPISRFIDMFELLVNDFA